jgi:hypothetical protein
MNTRSFVLLTLTFLIVRCNNNDIVSESFKLGEFGAFYTRINSGEEFEKYARVGDHADIVVDLGKNNMTLVFWRGSSYLPYLKTENGQWPVDEVIERNGDGTDQMPDRTNIYSFVKIISKSEDEVIIHWRYLPQFEGGNPQLGVSSDKFVDEYFYIKPSGEVKRTIQKGTARIDEWNDPANMLIHTFKLTPSGIKDVILNERSDYMTHESIAGSPLIEKVIVDPVAWWKFDEGVGNHTREYIKDISTEVAGHKTLWRKGVSGTALQFDGYFSEIILPPSDAPEISDAITLESWVALGAYPWSFVPVIQQADDEPEVLLTKKGGEAFLRGEEGREKFEESLEDEEEEESFDFVMKEEDDTGYFLGIDGYGNPSFKLRVGGKWEQLNTDFHLKRKQWYHITGTFDKISGEMKVFVNGKKVGQKQVAKSVIETSDKGIRIGKGKDRRPIRPVRDNTFSDTYSLDGLIDEVRIYDVALTDEQILESYQLFASNSEQFAQVPMDPRVLPAGENRGEFGGYYTHLKFYDVWDNLWRFADHPDVVVEFDINPSKFVFWRGTGYIPMMVNESGQWYSNEFNETWNKTGGEGCQEPMSDKEAYTNHVRIIENTQARTVVHWRYPLIDVKHVMANYEEEYGWCDWSDWYYYIYPDGIAVKTMHLWTHGERNHEWQESMGIFGPDQHPEDVINTKAALTMLSLSGDMITYDWVDHPPDNVDEPKEKCIQYINYTGEYKPVTIGEFGETDVYSGELTEYGAFPSWNHWPVAQMPSDGRYATYPDRTAHSSLTHVPPVVYKEERSGPTPFYQKILMEAMLNWNPEQLVPLARSWINAPEIKGMAGASGEYDPGQRAYVLTKRDSDISFSIEASDESPLVNPAFILKNWGDKKDVEVFVSDMKAECRQGIFRDTDGSKTMAIWIDINENSKVNFVIR